MPLRRAARVLLVGPPGAGKGTQTERLLKRYPQLSSIGSGDLLRDNVRNRTPLGIQAEATMKAGNLVPDTMILRVIINELTMRGWILNGEQKQLTLNSTAATLDGSALLGAFSATIDNFITPPPTPDDDLYPNEDPDASFVLDGFPRTAGQATQLDTYIPINLVVNIDTPASVIMDRICNRWVHVPSGRVYNTTFNAPKVPGKDDVTGEPLTRREDDDPETWKQRLRKFEETAAPMLEFYDKKGVLRTVSGNSSDEISPKLFAEFGRMFL